LKKLKILDLYVDCLTMEETIETISEHISSGDKMHHTVVNAMKYIDMRKNPELFDSVLNADLVSADGQFVVLVSKLYKNSIPERVTGCDLMQQLIPVAFEKKFKIYFLGAEDDVVKKVVNLYSEEYSPDIIAGYRSGFFSEKEEKGIIKEINNSGANILFVAMGSPRQELFIRKHKKEILKSVNLLMGVGGSFDVVAGKVKRAHDFFQNNGMEWLYRVMKQPSRIWTKGLYRLPLFFFYAFFDFLKGKFK